MTWTTLTLDADARGVARLTLNRPEKHNVLSGEMCDELAEAAARARRRPGVRVVVLTGAGASFCAGGDLGWMRAQFAATRAGRMAEARRLAGMLQALNTLGKPLIGRVNGAAYGGGVGLMAVCDSAVAAGGRPVRADRDPAGADPGDDLALRARADRRGAGAGACSSRPGSSTPAEAAASGS